MTTHDVNIIVHLSLWAYMQSIRIDYFWFILWPLWSRFWTVNELSYAAMQSFIIEKFLIYFVTIMVRVLNKQWIVLCSHAASTTLSVRYVYYLYKYRSYYGYKFFKHRFNHNFMFQRNNSYLIMILIERFYDNKFFT